jgi:hypothetical protein
MKDIYFSFLGGGLFWGTSSFLGEQDLTKKYKRFTKTGAYILKT